MLLRELNIVRLHGALNLNVQFKEDITLLVGINGCGKTSVLNVIDWLLKPNLKRLAVTAHAELTLIFDFKSKTYTIKSDRTPAKVTLSISAAGINVKPITVDLNKSLDLDDENSEDAYDGLGPEKHELPMWELLKSFTTPTVITLDRTITAEAEDIYYIDTPRGPTQRRMRARSPLAHVQEVTSGKYSEYRAKAIQHDNELKARIVMSALQDPEVVFQGGTIKPMTKLEINQLEDKVIKYLAGTIKTEDVTQQVRRFFNSSRMLAQQPQLTARKDRFLLDFVLSQYRQVENLAKAFNDFEVENSTAFAELRDYLTAVNSFFKDSNKSLYFDESTGRLVFSFLSAGHRKQEKRTITHLSSGEKQILILFTFLAFIAKTGSVFIVDEPELSLHPKWQHEFMEMFLRLRPPNTQLLLATHSPDIVGKFKHACVTLKGRENA